MIIYLLLFLFIQMISATLPNAQQIQIFSNTHNYYRSVVTPQTPYMPPLYWSSNLANSANNWATRCNFRHSGTPNVGENLYATNQRTPNPVNFNPTSSVNSWAQEMWYYNYTTNSCAKGRVCGHYTQIIWSNTVSLGCAFQDCPFLIGTPFSSGTIVVCQYSSPGNVVGMKPYCRF